MCRSLHRSLKATSYSSTTFPPRSSSKLPSACADGAGCALCAASACRTPFGGGADLDEDASDFALPGPVVSVKSAESSDEADSSARLRSGSDMKSSDVFADCLPFIGSSSIARSTSGSKIRRERRCGFARAITHDIAKGYFWKVFFNLQRWPTQRAAAIKGFSSYLFRDEVHPHAEARNAGDAPVYSTAV